MITSWTDLASAAAVAGLVAGATGAGLAWWRRRQRADVLLRVATIRTKGVELRNRGAYHLKSKKDFDDWQQEADAWDGRAEEELKGLAKHEAAIFATIDRFDPELDVLKDGRYLSDALIGQSSGENWHARRVAMLAFRVRELKSISARYAASASL